MSLRAGIKPTLYLYCQHSVGMGHLVRSIALARAMTGAFDVHMLSGGQPPAGFDLPPEVQLHHLPALSMEGSQLISQEPGMSVDEVRKARLDRIHALLADLPPDVLVTELYPLGRKKFAFELEPLIAAARCHEARVVCSVRDLLVTTRHDQQHHDDRAATKLNTSYDAIIVHADPVFAQLEETFRPTEPLKTAVYYSGFVIPNPPAPLVEPREHRVVVSAGGGVVGGPLFRMALAMHRQSDPLTRMPMTLVAGPFLPEDEWRDLNELADGLDDLTLIRSTPDLCAVINRATHSISQFGYNTAIDLMVTRVAAVVVPYAAAGETEQTERAQRLAAEGMVQVVPEASLTPEALARALTAARAPESGKAFALDGAGETTRILRGLLVRAQRPLVAAEITA